MEGRHAVCGSNETPAGEAGVWELTGSVGDARDKTKLQKVDCI